MGWLDGGFAGRLKLGKSGTRKNLPSDGNSFFCYNGEMKTIFFKKTSP